MGANGVTHSCTDVQAGPRFGMMGHHILRMTAAIKSGVVAFVGAALLLGCAVPGFGQGRGGHGGGSMGGHGGGSMGGGRVGAGGMSRAPMGHNGSSMGHAAPRMAPRVSSGAIASRARTSSVARTNRIASTSFNRRPVATYRTTRDRFGRLHRVRVVSFIGAGYPGYLGYYPYDYGYDQGSSGYDQGAYDSTQQSTPAAADQTASAPSQYASVAPDATVPDAGQLILVRTDGQILTPNAYTISGDRLVYITREGARLSFPVAELDKDTTRKMNAANGTNVVIPD